MSTPQVREAIKTIHVLAQSRRRHARRILPTAILEVGYGSGHRSNGELTHRHAAALGGKASAPARVVFRASLASCNARDRYARRAIGLSLRRWKYDDE